jgi:hypothetical protein
MVKTEKVVASNGDTILTLRYELGHLYIRDPEEGWSSDLWPDQVEQLYSALGRFLGKESSPGEPS